MIVLYLSLWFGKYLPIVAPLMILTNRCFLIIIHVEIPYYVCAYVSIMCVYKWKFVKPFWNTIFIKNISTVKPFYRSTGSLKKLSKTFYITYVKHYNDYILMLYTYNFNEIIKNFLSNFIDSCEIKLKYLYQNNDNKKIKNGFSLFFKYTLYIIIYLITTKKKTLFNKDFKNEYNIQY